MTPVSAGATSMRRDGSVKLSNVSARSAAADVRTTEISNAVDRTDILKFLRGMIAGIVSSQ